MFGESEQAVQRADQHFDMRHLALVVHGDAVDAFQFLVSDARFEFEDDLAAVYLFLGIGEILETMHHGVQDRHHIRL